MGIGVSECGIVGPVYYYLPPTPQPVHGGGNSRSARLTRSGVAWLSGLIIQRRAYWWIPAQRRSKPIVGSRVGRSG